VGSNTIAGRVLRLGRDVLRHPVHFCVYMLRHAAHFDGRAIYPTRGLHGMVTAAIDDRTRPFLDLPPATLLPQRDLADLLGDSHRPIGLPETNGDDAELPDREMRTVARVVATLSPSTMFEIGTYRGRTTTLLASCSPRSVVHTLDLAPEQMLEGGCFRELDETLIGTRFRGDPQTTPRIVQHFGDSREFDYRPFHGKVDFVFVDASHAYEAVLNDSAAALRMVRAGGAIMWDDYHPVHGPGVMQALSKLSATTPLVWIRGTRLAFYRAPGPSAVSGRLQPDSAVAY